MIDDTHDPALQSWVESANAPDCDFPIQNLPLGVFLHGPDPRPHLGVAIGDFVLDVRPWLGSSCNLNDYCALSASRRRNFRQQISQSLRLGARQRPLLPLPECRLLLPVAVPDYTDFYASIHHATNVGRLFRPDQPLMPNYQHVPIAYHGRSSSVVLSGSPVKRPHGQLGEGVFGPSRELDYELELGAFLGPGNLLGEPIPITQARQHWVGVCLLNDWSARDIQRWEYQPLGPFLAKNFATSISPWLVTAEALQPFRVSPPPHDTPPLPYLQSPAADDALDITLEVWFQSPHMTEPVRLSQSKYRDMYWTIPQMIAHHSSNGCPIRPGDLIGSGTVSGPLPQNHGCLLELTSKGREPVQLPDGQQRRFLEDGDQVILRGHCTREGFRRIGLGFCAGTILA